MELSKERDREHAERMLAMQKQQSTGGFGQIGEMLGMETPELLTRIFSGGGGSGGESSAGTAWSDAIPKVIGSIADIGKAALAAKMAMPSPEVRRPRPQPPQQPQPSVPSAHAAPTERPALPTNDPNDPLVQIPTPEGLKVVRMSVAQAMGFKPPPGMERSLTTNLDLPDQGSIPQPKETVKVKRKKPAQPATDQPAPAEAPKQKEAPKEAPAATPTPTKSAEAPSPQDQSPSAEGPHPLAVGKTVNTGDRAKAAGMKLLEIGKARKSIRALADKLRKSPEEEWTNIVIAAIMDNVGIFAYIEAVSLYAALAEADVDANLADSIATALRANEMVPATLTYTEQDYVAKQMAKESEA
jgi:hypothetical protein